jgi:hypothetical protein
MGDGDAGPGPLVQVKDVQPGTAGYGQVVALAAQVLAQDRYLVSSVPGAQESHLLGAFDGIRCVGFLRYLIQVIGAEAGRPAVMRNGEPLRERLRRGLRGRFTATPPRHRNRAPAARSAAVPHRRLLSDAIPQPGDKRRELRPEDRRRVRPAPQQRK